MILINVQVQYLMKDCTIKNEGKIEKLQSFDLSYFLGIFFVCVMMVFKICLFIKQHLVRWVLKRRKVMRVCYFLESKKFYLNLNFFYHMVLFGLT